MRIQLLSSAGQNRLADRAAFTSPALCRRSPRRVVRAYPACLRASKTSTWADRQAARDLWDLRALSRLGAIDSRAERLYRRYGPTNQPPSPARLLEGNLGVRTGRTSSGARLASRSRRTRHSERCRPPGHGSAARSRAGGARTRDQRIMSPAALTDELPPPERTYGPHARGFCREQAPGQPSALPSLSMMPSTSPANADSWASSSSVYSRACRREHAHRAHHPPDPSCTGRPR